MSDAAIELTNISKRYRLRQGWHVSSIKTEVGRLGARLLGRDLAPRDDFWALRDVNLSLPRGTVLGLVGTNGAGKSTLLKVLSRVTVPTSGTFVAQGRIGALIEIGAGFHPELTGRENIFLNGAIMGMSRNEIQRKFDRIVTFAEIDRFLDTPIKHYSSGMQMRLGFAVAAHIDPDILLIDEILAVGDARFQAKCLNKLAELKEQDKTIILVSHTLANITEHSKTALWIDHGTARMLGDPEEVIDAYLNHVTSMTGEEDTSREDPSAGWEKPIAIGEVTTTDGHERPRTRFDRGDIMVVDISYAASQAVPGAVFGVSVQDVHGYSLGGVLTDADSVKVPAPVDRAVLRLVLNPLLFNKGAYTLTVHVTDPVTKRYYDIKRRAARFFVEGTRASGRDSSGYVYYPHEWEQVK